MTESLYNIVVEKHAVSNKVRLFKHWILFVELGNPLFSRVLLCECTLQQKLNGAQIILSEHKISVPQTLAEMTKCLFSALLTR